MILGVTNLGDSLTQDSELAWTCVQDSRLSLNPHSLVVIYLAENMLTTAISNPSRCSGGLSFAQCLRCFGLFFGCVWGCVQMDHRFRTYRCAGESRTLSSCVDIRCLSKVRSSHECRQTRNMS
jgi:hypothetical protein